MKKVFKYLSLIIVSTLIMISGTLVVNAASASISVTSGTSRIVVGKELAVTEGLWSDLWELERPLGRV